MNELPEYVPSKDELKRELPLAFACARLGIALDRDGNGLCPFHQDSSPSFGVYANDRGEQRWHCFPCGLDGDVFDLVQNLENCTFKEALGRVEELWRELPEGYVAEVTTTPKARSYTADDMNRVVNDARARAEVQPGVLSARVGFVDVHQEALAAKWDEYIRSTWGWGVTEMGDVIMPHWSADSPPTLTGYKQRKLSGERLSFGDYALQVYGAWLGKVGNELLLTEGETDCVWAAFTAREEGLSLDVRALPSGAGDDVDPAWLKQVARYRTIYLAFDPDEAGVKATWRWAAALSQAGMGEKFRFCALPLGRDLRDAKPVLRTLITQARTPLERPEGIEDLKGYIRALPDGGFKRLTSWTVEPIAKLVGEDAAGYDVELTYRGVTSRTVIRLADLSSSRDAKKWCNRHGLLFTATDSDLQRIAEYIEWRGCVVPEVFQTDQVGLQEHAEGYEFAGRSVALPDGYLGQMPWRYVPSARAADVSRDVLLPATGRFEWKWLEDFLLLSKEEVTHPLLSWLVAAARRPEARQFPLLFVGGSSGVGKSTLASLALRLLGSMITLDLGNVTPFILVRTLAATTSLPMFIDEWTRLSRRDARDAFQGNIPILYAGGSAERGQADLSSAVYRLTAPVIVAGEDAFILDREIERMVMINPTRTAQNSQALGRIIDKPLERFGQLLHSWLATGPDLLSLAEISAPDRRSYNRRVLEEGWATLRALVHEAGRYDPDVPELSDTPNLSVLDTREDDDEENVYEQALLWGASVRDQDGHAVVWADPDGAGTWVRLQVLVGLIQSRNIDLQLPGGSRAMKAYLEERFSTLVLGKAVTPPNTFTPLRAWLIKGYELPGAREPDIRTSGYMPE